MEMIEQRRLGKSGLAVPAMGIGTDSWGEKMLGYGKRYTRDDLYEAYRACLDAGLTYFDSAPGYGRGESERLLGEFRRQDGRPIIIATKFDNPMFPSRARSRSSVRSVTHALESSLERLHVERIDLYQIHFPIHPDAMDEHMGVLADTVRSGTVRAVGVSNFNASLMRQAHASLARFGIALAANQVSYNLLMRNPETNGVLSACRELDVALIPYIPLAVGVLTGKYRGGATSLTAMQRMFFFLGKLDIFHEAGSAQGLLKRLSAKPHPVQFDRLEPLFVVLEEIAVARGKTIVQVALNWLLSQDQCIIPIPGAKNAKQARENAGAIGWRLTGEERRRIDSAESASR
jgi:aryl-alcohol dehydrogenase-like predicted oxidoreductase